MINGHFEFGYVLRDYLTNQIEEANNHAHGCRFAYEAADA